MGSSRTNLQAVSSLIKNNLSSLSSGVFQYDSALSQSAELSFSTKMTADYLPRARVLEQRLEEVTKANLKFYQAFESLDIGKMDEVWAHLEYVTCVHPGWTLRSDWPSVRDSWVLIFNNTFSMRFELTEVMVQVAGDMAWVICVENITSQQSDEPQQARVLATNLFERIGDEWLMIHHHGSTVMG